MTPKQRTVDTLIAEYLVSIDNGQPMSREQLVDTHAEFAEELTKFFRDMDAFGRLIDGAREVMDRRRDQSDRSG